MKVSKRVFFLIFWWFFIPSTQIQAESEFWPITPETENPEKLRQSFSQLKRNPFNAFFLGELESVVQNSQFEKAHKTGNPESQDLEKKGFFASHGHFLKHVKDAIATNLSRKKIYSEKTGGASLILSSRLIFLERLSIPVASYIDAKARSFQAQGIPIISGDFVSMEGIKPADSPPTYSNIMSKTALDSLKTSLKNYRKELLQSLKARDFENAGKISYETLLHVRRLELSNNSHLVLTCHLLESIGFASLHALNNSKNTQGRTDGLSKIFIQVQAMPLLWGVPLDGLAQTFHSKGVGILVNDLPSIPFELEWEAFLGNNSKHQTGKPWPGINPKGGNGHFSYKEEPDRE